MGLLMDLTQLVLLLTLFRVAEVQQLEWDATNLPNPTGGDFKRCSMRTTSKICDPDAVLTEQQRYRLNHQLHQLESRTRQESAPDFCQKKGITAAMAIVKRLKGGTEQAAREMANSVLNNWSLDQQCQKSLVIVLSTEDRRFWVARGPKVPVYANEFTQIFDSQKQLFSAGNFVQALLNVLQLSWEKALSKQSRLSTDAEKPLGPSPPSYTDQGIKGIPFWVWLLPLVLIPLLCCCCFCYFCCRSKGNSNNDHQAEPFNDAEHGYKPAPTGYSRPNREGTGINNFLSGLGGAGLGSLAGRFISDRFGRNRNSAAARGYQDNVPAYRSGQQDTVGRMPPTIKEEKSEGLYPTAVVHDAGGGGSWK